MRLHRSGPNGSEQCVEIAPRPGSANTEVADAGASSAPAQRLRPEVRVVHAADCTLCGSCLDACMRGAISLNGAVTVDTRLCVACGACVEACPTGVLELIEV